jgi:hypothetical protein
MANKPICGVVSLQNYRSFPAISPTPLKSLMNPSSLRKDREINAIFLYDICVTQNGRGPFGGEALRKIKRVRRLKE